MILPVFIPHLGCPHQCVFCNQRTISGETESGLGGPTAAGGAQYLGAAQPGKPAGLLRGFLYGP